MCVELVIKALFMFFGGVLLCEDILDLNVCIVVVLTQIHF